MNLSTENAGRANNQDHRPQVSLVMPCYNEEDALRETAPSLIHAFAKDGIDFQLILVDNGSTDGTGAIIDALIAEGMPITKVTIDVNQGYGNGILCGLAECRAPLVGYLCADGQVAPEDTVRAYYLIVNREDRVLAKVRRRFRQDSWRRKIVSIIYNGLMLLVFGWLSAIDINGSPKIFSRRTLDAMKLVSNDWFLDPEIIIKAKALGLRVIEVDVEGYARRGGISNVRVRTCFEFLKNIWRYRTGSQLRKWRKDLREAEAHQPAPVEMAGEDRGRTPSPSAMRIVEKRARASFDEIRVLEQVRREDARGFLHKVLRSSQGVGQPASWEIYVSAGNPGEAKGNHIHHRMGEWFGVIQGEGSIEVADPDSGERRSLPVSASQPRAVYIPAGLAHAIVNRGEELLICVAWAEAEHDPEDVFPWSVWPPESEDGSRRA